MTKRLYILLPVLLLLIQSPSYTQEKEKEITVSAASSLTDVLKELGPVFKQKTGTKAVFNFGSSGSLYQQIEKGAPVDVFISADQDIVDKGIKAEVLRSSTKTILLKNTLVLIQPKTSELKIKKLEDLQLPEIKKIAIGNPSSVPAGKYAEEVLTKNHLNISLKEKFIPAENVRQVLDYVGREEVEVGFVYVTDAAIAESKVKVALILSGHKPILYPGILVTGTKNSEEAKSFLEFLKKSPEAKETFLKYKFILP
ncbi:molybdate ABC transporter substrate-binding protein [Leptospira dzoumogneensis]|uniref:Molybdate ABC transporter substrate-binding protein n=1 Tax=Leptospira dzoumogneensis TaxID=2484904 RepID=A0A4Z1ACR3_9LEPT|nr:molybdate ABC transporter substrate-binding protein [Leptospira dzoumogneensis]TGM99474.1 molybdate ABC transporter substrate-binding protein [Leptospira dzoumogneensis]